MDGNGLGFLFLGWDCLYDNIMIVSYGGCGCGLFGFGLGMLHIFIGASCVVLV